MLTGHKTQQICLRVCNPVAGQEFPWFNVTQSFLSLLTKPRRLHQNMHNILT
jgi:hypothetical protein